MLASLILGVVLMNVLAFALVVARSIVFHTRLYRPMLLNLALSIAPLLVLVAGLAVVILSRFVVPGPVVGVLLVVVAVVWLLLLPNAGYLITELQPEPPPRRRRGADVVRRRARDLARDVGRAQHRAQRLRRRSWSGCSRCTATTQPRCWASTRGSMVVAILVLVSFGMYLGRSVRLNSWDVRHPRVAGGEGRWDTCARPVRWATRWASRSCTPCSSGSSTSWSSGRSSRGSIALEQPR